MKPLYLFLFVCFSVSIGGNVNVRAVVPVGDTLPTPAPRERTSYREISYPTPNVDPERVNTVEGVILHHTAEPTVERSLEILSSRARKVGTHCVIDTDGTRYIMCRPEQVTFHAGPSILNARSGCNGFTIGIEFQGNTLETPLTEDQIRSAVEYLRPIMRKYAIPLKMVVTHQMVRDAYLKRHPKSRTKSKVDITPAEYRRVIRALEGQ